MSTVGLVAREDGRDIGEVAARVDGQHIESPVSMKAAKDLRLELMDERKEFKVLC